MLGITKSDPKREDNIMNSYIRSVRNLPIAIAMTIFFICCSPLATEYREQGFSYIQKGFAQLPDSPDLYEVIVIDRLKIIIVGSRKHFKWTKARHADSRLLGYATRKNEIYLFGKRIGDKIVVNQAILGHELNHILKFNNHKLANPHHLDMLEFCALRSGKC